MYVLGIGTFIERILRSIFLLIDGVIYKQIPRLYDLIMAIARTSPLSQATIADMSSRIYKLLAVFMIFKVTFSLIMYVVNPDDFSDKTKGVSKLITNIVISLGLLVLTPYIFSYAFQFQKIILEDNALATIIFGNELSAENNVLGTAGDKMAYAALSPFITPNTNNFNCSTLYSKDNDNPDTEKILLNPDCFGFKDVDVYIEDTTANCASSTDSNYISLCIAANNSNGTAISKEDVSNYAAGISLSNYNFILNKSIVTAMYGDDFAFDYHFLISTVVGVVALLLLITTCMDIGLRSIKLAFLQLIAPIPILSYVDPKSGKDGMFKKWYQMCLKTFLSLFIKLLAIYFAMYIIGRIGKLVDIIDGSYITNGYVKIFIIIGALMFAKNFTKILESLGIKLDGATGFQLNPFKKLEDEAAGMKKPAAFANKVAKGVLTSPVSGIQTFGKKMIGGIDAAKNGKGFRQGWNRTHGKLHNSFYKKLDEWAPDSAENRKNERLGREEVKYMNTKWNKGKQEATKIANYIKAQRKAGNTNFDYEGYDSPYKALNGKDEGAYRAVYKNEQFIKSRMALDQKDEARKALDRVNEATLRGETLDKALMSQKKELEANLDQATFKKLFNVAVDENGNAKLDDKGNMIVTGTNGDLTSFAKVRDDTNKAVSGMEKVHESIRKQYQADAATEDAIKFIKYNPIDPTDPGKAEADYDLKTPKKSETPVQPIQQEPVAPAQSAPTEFRPQSASTETTNVPSADQSYESFRAQIDRNVGIQQEPTSEEHLESETKYNEMFSDQATVKELELRNQRQALIDRYNSLPDSVNPEVKRQLMKQIEEIEHQIEDIK